MVRRQKKILLLIFICIHLLGWSNENNKIISSLREGAYSTNQTLALSLQDARELFYYSLNPDGPFLPYENPIELSSSQGETRRYDIYLKKDIAEVAYIQKFTFIIDKAIPRQPRPILSPGMYFGEQKLQFSGKNQGIYVSIEEYGSQMQFLEPYEQLVLKAPEKGVQTYSIIAFRSNLAGHRSPVFKGQYQIRAPLGEDDLKIYSPVEGDFVNKQLLHINTKGLEWIKYTWQDEDPATKGETYKEPIIIDKEGKVRLKLAFKPLASTNIINKEIEYTINTAIEEKIDFPSGIYSEKIVLDMDKIGTKVLYTFSDDPRISFMTYTAPIEIEAVSGSTIGMPFVFQVRKGDNRLGPLHRYYYIQDNRKAVAPQAILTYPAEKTLRISLTGHPAGVIHYTLDGSVPDISSPRYTRELKIDSSTGDIVELRAISFFPLGDKSTELREAIILPQWLPDLNDARIVKKNSGEYRLLTNDYENLTVGIRSEDQELKLDQLSPVMEDWSYRVPLGFEEKVIIVLCRKNKEQWNYKEYVLDVDNAPPEMPRIEIREGLVYLSGEGKLFLEVQENEGEPQSLPYENPYPLSGREDQLITYRIRSWAEDEKGNRSEFTWPQIYSVDRQKPQINKIQGVVKGSVYNSPYLDIFMSAVNEDAEIRYTYSSHGEIPEDPDQSSLLYTGPVRVSAEEGEEKYYKFKMIVYRTGYSPSPIEEIDFLLDRKPPKMPKTNWPKGNIATNQNLTYELTEIDSDALVFYSLTEGDIEPGDPFVYGKLYSEPILFDLIPNKEKKYQMRVAVRDKAGNRQSEELFYNILLDGSAPGAPEYEVTPNELSTTVSFNRMEGDRIFYRIIEGGDYGTFIEYTDPIELEHSDGIIRQINIETLVMDRSGNRSPVTPIGPILLDGRRAQAVNPPQFFYFGNKIALSFEVSDGQTLYIKLPGMEGFESYHEYKETLVLPKERIEGLIIYAYQVSGNGKSSSEVSFPLYSHGAIAAVPITGIEDGGVYNEDIVVSVKAPDVYFRYEIAHNGESPAPITEFSPLFREEFVQNTFPGEIRSYKIRFQAFINSTDQPIGEEYQYSFIVDTVPPPIPGVEEVLANEVYNDELRINLNGQGEVFYRLLTESEERLPFVSFTEPFYLNVRKGEIKNYILEAYSSDEAGNRSELLRIPFSIDRAVIYVSPFGNDDNNGTRNEPVKSMERAFFLLNYTGKTALYLASGEYELNSTIVLNNSELILKGGFDPVSWNQSETPSSLFLGPYYENGEGMFEVLGGELTLSGINLNLYDSRIDRIIFQRSGKVYLLNQVYEDSNFTLDSFITTVGGELHIIESEISYNSSFENSFILAKGGSLFIDGLSCVISGKNTPAQFIKAKDLDLIEINRSRFTMEEALKSRVLELVNAPLNLYDSTFLWENALGLNVAIDIKSSDIQILRSVFSANGSGQFTFLKLDNSQGVIKDSFLNTQEVGGARYLQLEESSLRVNKTRFVSRLGANFVYMIQTKNSELEMLNNYVQLEDVGDLQFISFIGGEGKLYHNTISLKGRKSVRGVHLIQDAVLKFQNNIFNSDNFIGTAFVGENTLRISRITSNCFYGWQKLVEDRSNNKIIDNIDLLNRYDGDPYKGYISSNLIEDPRESFTQTDSKQGIYHLKETSRCVDKGEIISTLSETSDWDGEARPNPQGWNQADIGADEWYPNP